MELAIDSVGIQSSVAVSDEGRCLVEITWPTGRRHTPSLVPTIDHACRLAGVAPAGLTAVFVDLGPGAYGGIRAGIATAAGIALARGIPALGVGRLEIEAFAHAAAARPAPPLPIAAVHAAGRAEWALALYRGPASAWAELQPPTLFTRRDLIDRLLTPLRGLAPGGVLCGEADRLGPDALALLQSAGWTRAAPAASMRRAAVLAELAAPRLRAARQAGTDLSPARLQPLYLREPAIGPQPPITQEPALGDRGPAAFPAREAQA